MNKWIYITIIIIVIAIGAVLYSSGIFNAKDIAQQSKQAEITKQPALSGNGVYRLLQDNVKSGQEFDVFLNISLENQRYYIIDETIPQGFEIIDSSAGTINENHVKWVVFSNAKSAVLSYKLRAPAISGVYEFSGNFMIDDDEKIILGKNNIRVN